MAHVVTGVLRRAGRAVGSLGPATVAVAIALVIGAAGFADAATGGNFLLGDTNTESSTAVMTDTTGIPLSLNAPAGKSPFSVNSTTQVNRLNAQYVGGDSAAQLQSSGGAGITAEGQDTAVVHSPTTVATTGALPAGTYYVSATALLYAGGKPAYCQIDADPPSLGGGDSPGYTQAAETTVVTVPANARLSEQCYGSGTAQFAYDAAIIAIRIDSSSTGTVPASVLPRGLPRHRLIGPPTTGLVSRRLP
jgi:hypothetical protein